MRHRLLCIGIAALAVTALQGCVYRTIYQAATGTGDFYPVDTEKVAYDPSKQARLRVRGGDVTPVSACYGAAPVAANVKRAVLFTQLLNTGVVATSYSIGMPRPAGKNTTVWHEEVHAAGQPITIRGTLAFDQPVEGMPGMFNRIRCDAGAGAFVPQAGRDYESDIYFDGKICRIQVREVYPDGTVTGQPDVVLARAPACP